MAITYAKDAAAASAVVKAIELGGGEAIAIQADAADAKVAAMRLLRSAGFAALLALQSTLHKGEKLDTT